jgi:predicted dehydrogenase
LKGICIEMEQVKVAVIGTGLIGSHYARICRQMAGVELVAVCDVVADRAEALAKELGAIPYAGNAYRQTLQEQPGLDAVIVSTPEDTHADAAIAALEAGKHLFVEKPLAATAIDARRIAAAGVAKAQVTMVGYSLRFDPRYAAMQEAVAGGEIGTITHIYARRTPPAAALERIKGRVELPFWVGVHDIDMMRWVTGSEVCRVFATSIDKGIENWKVKAAIFANLTFENGAIAVLENAWGPVSASKRQLSSAFFRVQGTRGFIEVKSHEQGVTMVRDGETFSPDTVYMPTLHGRITGVYHDQIAYFIDCVREGKRSEISLMDGLKGVIIAEAIIRSAEQQQVIDLGTISL